MNCQDHLYRNADPRQVSRRWFLEQCGVGLGSIALGQLLQGGRLRRGRRPRPRGVESAGSQGASSRAQGQAGVVPVHGRGAQPSGAVRQQAATGQVRRHAAAARADQGLSRGVHQAQLEAARPQVQVCPARPERHRALRAAAAPGDGGRRHRRRQGDGHRRLQPRARPDHDEHRLADLRPAEHRRLGRLRPGQRVAGPARLRRLQHRQERAQRRQFQLGQRLPAHRLPGRPVPHQRRPGLVSLQPPRGRRRPPARLARRGQQAQPAAARARSAIPRSPPGSTRSRWPSACSSRLPT